MLLRWLTVPFVLLAASGALADDRVRILVVDLQAKGEVLSDEADIVSGLVTARLQRYRKVAVLSGADVRELIALEAQKQATGCDTASCLAEVAGALGAELIVTGTVGKLGDEYVITLNLIDVGKASALARETEQIGDLSDARGAVRALVDDLVEPMRKRVGEPEDDISFFEAADATLTWTGWGLAGVGASTLLVQHLIFVIAYLGLDSRPIDTAYVPVCGPFFVFLNEGVDPDPAKSDDISTLGFGCCLCELLSCGMCLAAPAVLGGGAIFGLFDSEDGDAAAAARLGAPPSAPLDDDERRQLAQRMPY